MDLANPRVLTLDDFKEYFRLVINTHTSSTYTVDKKDNYLITVEGVAVYRVIYNKPSTFEFKDLRGNWLNKHLPFEQGSDPHETLPKLVLDGFQRFIVLRA